MYLSHQLAVNKLIIKVLILNLDYKLSYLLRIGDVHKLFNLQFKIQGYRSLIKFIIFFNTI